MKESKKFETNVCTTEPSVEKILSLPKVDGTWPMWKDIGYYKKTQNPNLHMVQLLVKIVLEGSEGETVNVITWAAMNV